MIHSVFLYLKFLAFFWATFAFYTLLQTSSTLILYSFFNLKLINISTKKQKQAFVAIYARGQDKASHTRSSLRSTLVFRALLLAHKPRISTSILVAAPFAHLII